jgi:hypothetical protein
MTNALFTQPADGLRMLFAIGNDTPYFTEHYYSAMNNWVRQYESNLYNDAHTMIRFNAVLRLFSFGHYHVHTVFASFISLIGLVALLWRLANDWRQSSSLIDTYQEALKSERAENQILRDQIRRTKKDDE